MTTTTPTPERTRSRPTEPLLEVDGLTVRYETLHGDVQAINELSFSISPGESLGLVGESGCGKSSVALALLRLLPKNARIDAGSIRLEGKDLLSVSDREMRGHRWNDISMVFQGAMNSWNPVYTVFSQIEEALRVHWPATTRSEARGRVAELFEMVGLPPDMMDRYPHEYSGGMRQRAIIAMALSCDPKLIIADEPTTALDVIVQDRILGQLKRIQSELDLSIMYISHDIAVIAEVADRLGVMYAGKMAELGDTDAVFRHPRHPYSWSLLTSTPSIRGPLRTLSPLEGEPPDLREPLVGCPFEPRCALSTEQCATHMPPLEQVTAHQSAACWHSDQVPDPAEKETLA
ncbi:ABC transporter ATP-binding protein [Egibacter rhizosphaerae]|uniref:ABC transporter ATP-binding protein n=1 Tax=Egibacter rhizosphaerae TaxID=1670831 RepID=A0A411YKP4_9ACTN|nr:ABC transporter ATP-binding protein [Egibacter rhizosphaerae]QBI21753.1 ABC transporter ATP-binding protein [Egibacter rhizosphaerae]